MASLRFTAKIGPSNEVIHYQSCGPDESQFRIMPANNDCQVGPALMEIQIVAIDRLCCAYAASQHTQLLFTQFQLEDKNGPLNPSIDG